MSSNVLTSHQHNQSFQRNGARKHAITDVTQIDFSHYGIDNQIGDEMGRCRSSSINRGRFDDA